ncbi:RHS repeat-associated core domain-containing protein [Chloroflexi bacterium CFX6]|nr:RHS repeat-associated core domain-containing protein [Chloroflexi bacterium CFX6]
MDPKSIAGICKKKQISKGYEHLYSKKKIVWSICYTWRILRIASSDPVTAQCIGTPSSFVVGIYEIDKSPSGSAVSATTYYPVGGAMRVDGALYFVLKDHLGSASVVTDSTGNVVGENRYYPFGETRLTTGTMYTDRLYTGQREMADLGIYHYNARFYSPRLGRFLSADTIVPNPLDPQDLNRFSYVRNNPLRYVDPSGHDPMCGFSYSDPECVSPDPWVPPSTPNNNGSGSNSGSSNNNGGITTMAEVARVCAFRLQVSPQHQILATTRYKIVHLAHIASMQPKQRSCIKEIPSFGGG